MTSAKSVILTTIHFKGLEQVKSEAISLAESCLCSVSYVNSIINKVKKGEIKIS